MIDHISAYVDYTLSMTNPFHLSDEELAEKQKIKDIIIPFLREHEELTQADQLFLNRLKYSYPTRVSEEQYQSLVGKTVDYNGRQYVVDRVDIAKNKAHIRDDNTGWYPLFQDVELRDIVGQNIDLILDEKEQFFRDCDLPALLAKSSLAWDEIESLGYIFFDEGYIDKYNPSNTALYGNGSFAEPEVYDLARKYKNGEDVSKELAEGLFLYSNGGIPATRIPYEDSYLEDLDLQINRTETGFLVNYGAYSREVTFEEISLAYLQYFENEYKDIQKAVAEEETKIAVKKVVRELGYDFDTEKDKFFFTPYGVEEIYYNPDSSEGGQFVISQISYEDILEAEAATVNIKDVVPQTTAFFEQLESNSNQTAVDITSDEFGAYVERFNQPFDLEGGNTSTMYELTARARVQIEQRNNTAVPKQEQPSQKNTTGTFKIYQMKSGEEYHFKRFEGLERQPEPVSISDYDLVYEGTLSDTDTLEIIYEQFNINRPEDFKGHSLSVSDVVVIEQGGQQQAHFVDSIGFKDVPDFFVERTQKAEQTPEQPEEKAPEKTETENKGSVSLRKVGDFFEMYSKDAEIGAEVLGLHMLSKNGSPMVGFPEHIKNEYSAKLKEAGYTVLIEQVFELNPSSQEPNKLDTQQESKNYQITDLSLGQRKTAVKFEDNLAAIRTLKQLEAEDRDASENCLLMMNLKPQENPQ